MDRTHRLRVTVVGAGIVGASVAYHLARAGAEVTILSEGPAGAGVTAQSFAWIGSSGVRRDPAAELRSVAVDEYRRFQRELPELPVTWSGSLGWAADDLSSPAGPGQSIIGARAIVQIEPNLREPPEWAVWAPKDGSVDASRVARSLIAGARAYGARVLIGTPASRVRTNVDGRVAGVETASGVVDASVVVLAAGVASRGLAAPLGVVVPVEASPASLFTFSSPAGLVRTVVHNELFDLRQASPTRLIAAADDPDLTLSAIRSQFRDSNDVRLLSQRVGDRPMPVDGEPIIGPVHAAPGLYLAVMHSAVTLAAVVGHLASTEILSGVPEPMLSGCRPGRF